MLRIFDWHLRLIGAEGKNFKQRLVNIILGILRSFSSPAVKEYNLYSLPVFMLGHSIIRNSIFSAKVLIVAAEGGEKF